MVADPRKPYHAPSTPPQDPRVGYALRPGERPTYGPRHPPPGPASTEPPAALRALRAAGRSSRFLIPAGILAATAVANEPGIAQAATNWSTGLSMPLDDGVKMTAPNMVNESRKNWAARDQEAFEAAVGRFSEQIAKLRESFKTIGGLTDEVAGTYRKYWMEIAALAAIALAVSARVKVAKMLPQSRVMAIIHEMLLGKHAYGTVGLMVAQLGLLLGSASRAMTMETRKWHLLHYATPSGPLKIDFDRAEIDKTGLPSFQKPSRPGELPPGSDRFDWTAPRAGCTQDRTRTMSGL